MFPSDNKMKILIHTLGREHSKVVTRNHYVAGPNHHSFKALDELVNEGFMDKEIDPFDNNRFVYRATMEGNLLVEVYFERQEEDNKL